jgi:hypothetical protein
MSGHLTRRGVLAGALAMPWLVACGPAVDERPALDLEDGTLSSRYWPGQPVQWRLARPRDPGADSARQRLVVALHCQGGDADWPFSGVHIDRHVVPTGLAVATIYGGDYYWHARRSGIDPGQMVIDDLLPLLDGKGLATDRIGLIGWSMGGYGALLMATRLGPRRVAGVAAVSAALWQSYDESFPVAFDDRADYVRNDVFSARSKLRGIPVRLDCGRDDLFIEANRAFARGLPGVTATFDGGGHTEEYWSTHAGSEMSWLRERF